MSVLTAFDPEFEYAEECYRYLLKRETQRSQYHNRSPQMDYRKQLITRLKILCFVYKLSNEVKYLSIYIIDFFMDCHDICEDRLELMTVSSILIAAKVEETDNKIPKINQLLSDPNQYLKSESLEMESKILQFFGWVFLTPTAATYINYFYIKCLPPININSKTRALVEDYMEKSIDTRFYSFCPSLIAASIIYCVRNKLSLEPFWTQTAQNITKYSFKQIESCVYELTKYEYLLSPKRMKVSVNPLLNDSGFFDFDK